MILENYNNILKKYSRLIAALQFITICYMPILIFFMVWIVGDYYISSTDLSFDYIGKEPIHLQEVNSAEIYGVYDFWAYIADNEEEYNIKYKANGMSSDIVDAIEFEDYILVMSLHRPLTAIRVMENDPVWQESVPYSYPQFVFSKEEEKNMVYYYKVYRIDTKYKRQGEETINRLKLWCESYYERKSGKHPKPKPMIESGGALKRWKWAFDLFNTN